MAEEEREWRMRTGGSGGGVAEEEHRFDVWSVEQKELQPSATLREK
jgi:hypothetical protein